MSSDDTKTYPFMNSGHGGSHPHPAHEVVRSSVEERAPTVNAVTAADGTAPGTCAQKSALQDGEAVAVPAFDLDTRAEYARRRAGLRRAPGEDAIALALSDNNDDKEKNADHA